MRNKFLTAQDIVITARENELVATSRKALDLYISTCISPVVIKRLKLTKTQGEPYPDLDVKKIVNFTPLITFQLLYNFLYWCDELVNKTDELVKIGLALLDSSFLVKTKRIPVLVLHILGDAFDFKNRGVLHFIGLSSPFWSALNALDTPSEKLRDLFDTGYPRFYGFFDELVKNISSFFLFESALDSGKNSSLFLLAGKHSGVIVNALQPISDHRRILEIESDLQKITEILSKLNLIARSPYLDDLIVVINHYGGIVNNVIQDINLKGRGSAAVGFNFLRRNYSEITGFKTTIKKIHDARNNMRLELDEKLLDFGIELKDLMCTLFVKLDHIELNNAFFPGFLTKHIENSLINFWSAFCAQLNILSSDGECSFISFYGVCNYENRLARLQNFVDDSDLDEATFEHRDILIARIRHEIEANKFQDNYYDQRYNVLVQEIVNKRVANFQGELIALCKDSVNSSALYELQDQLSKVLTVDLLTRKEDVLISLKEQIGDFSVTNFMREKILYFEDEFVFNAVFLKACLQIVIPLGQKIKDLASQIIEKINQSVLIDKIDERYEYFEKNLPDSLVYEISRNYQGDVFTKIFALISSLKDTSSRSSLSLPCCIF